MKKQFKDRESGFYLKNNGTFVIEDYNLTKPFANFFPGIAGEYGVPIWAFYVNRGQCISSFGTKDKDHALLEFFPANKAWQLTPNLGFRSFLKITDKNKHIFYEPFHNGYASSCFQLKNMMLITSFDLTIKEENRSLGLETEINYFPIPNERFAALGRIVRIKNRSRRQKVIQFLDGLPAIIPMGIGNRFLKDLNRTAEAWMKAQTVGDCAAFYKLDVDPSDRPQVIHIKEGNFCMSFTRPIIDASSIFGPRLNFDYPYNFIKNKKFVFPRNQVCESKTPCGMGLAEFSLRPDEERSFCSLFGSIASQNLLNQRLPEIKKAEFFMLKKAENKEIILKLEEDIDTKSSSCEFNYYCRQTYLDNIIRGGYPVIFDSVNDKKQVFYLYLRKHGDLERDYNKFYIQPTYFSQGNGNFRDIVQNRRSDVWFNPEVEESNLITFFNLIQTDGYNPLIVKGLRFHLKNRGNFEKTCLEYFKEEDDAKKLLDFLDKPFTPGGVVYFIEKNNFTMKKSSKDFLNILMVNSLKEEDAEHAQENHHMHGGYWSDHWTYCLDLLEAYLEIYPEKIKDLLFNKREFKF
ncbi:MAG: hypothetical protein KJ838_01885, partial [Candidatus Omnitrophica bacterium]|nr:hypothetical protein [Candidatus Omnitrophota bacterium]